MAVNMAMPSTAKIAMTRYNRGRQAIAASMLLQARMRKLTRSPVMTEATMEIRAMMAAQLAVRPLLEVAIATTTTNAGKHALAR